MRHAKRHRVPRVSRDRTAKRPGAATTEHRDSIHFELSRAADPLPRAEERTNLARTLDRGMAFDIINDMARCTAPVQGHRTASGAAACPVHGGSSGRYGGYRSYPPPSYSYPSYSSAPSSGGGPARVSGSASGVRPRWSPPGSAVSYTPAEVRALTPVRESVEARATLPDRRDVFLCHAWDDRQLAAKDLHDLLESCGVSVWFSEKDIALGSSLLREIDKGLAKSRIGIVLVTPALLSRLEGEGIADKELSVLLARELLVPIVHGTTYEALREVSPMLASRSGLSTADGQMGNVVAKISELITL